MSTLRGILPVLATPYDAGGEIVESEVRALVRWLLDQGAHGLSAVGEASESSRMTREERMRLAEVVFDETRGRVPVIVGVSAPNARESAILAEHAGSLGAAAVFLMPTAGAGYDETLAAFRRVAELEGILPALEPAHALAWLMANPGPGLHLVTLSGRGDKDLAEVLALEGRPG